MSRLLIVTRQTTRSESPAHTGRGRRGWQGQTPEAETGMGGGGHSAGTRLGGKGRSSPRPPGGSGHPLRTGCLPPGTLVPCLRSVGCPGRGHLRRAFHPHCSQHWGESLSPAGGGGGRLNGHRLPGPQRGQPPCAAFARAGSLGPLASLTVAGGRPTCRLLKPPNVPGVLGPPRPSFPQPPQATLGRVRRLIPMLGKLGSHRLRQPRPRAA